MVGSICGGSGTFFSNCVDVDNIEPLVGGFFKLLFSNCVGDVGFGDFFANKGMLNMIALCVFLRRFDTNFCSLFFFFWFENSFYLIQPCTVVSVCRTRWFETAKCAISAASVCAKVNLNTSQVTYMGSLFQTDSTDTREKIKLNQFHTFWKKNLLFDGQRIPNRMNIEQSQISETISEKSNLVIYYCSVCKYIVCWRW